MKWFKHFTSAHDNNDLTKVRMRYGADGYAVYWYCLELIAGDLGTTEAINFELKHDAEVIGFNLKIDSTRVEEIMIYMVKLGLFEASNNIITCFKLAKYLDKKTTRNSRIHEIIDAASLSATNTDKSGRSALDTDTDTEYLSNDRYIAVAKEKTTSKVNNFKAPTIDQILDLMREKGCDSKVEALKFFNFYESKGWVVGKHKMKNWKAACNGWILRNSEKGKFDGNTKPMSLVDRVRINAERREAERAISEGYGSVLAADD